MERTGTHYNYQRDYSPGVGRYLQTDPIGIDGGVNVFVYAEENPVKLNDPTGQQAVLPGPGGIPFQFRVLHLEGLDLRQLIQQIRVDLLMAQIL